MAQQYAFITNGGTYEKRNPIIQKYTATKYLNEILHSYRQCCPKRFSIKTKKGSKAKVEITTLAKSTTSFTSYGKYNTFRTSNR